MGSETSLNRPKLLVVAAWEPELARFRSGMARAGRADIEVVLETLGVGLVEAAIEMTLCIVRHRPSAALLLGTCGAFEESVVGSVITGAGVRLVDGSVTLGTAALPPPMPALATFDAALHDALALAGAKSVQIANTVGITTDDALAASLARAGGHLDVEHLEAFAFARACATGGVRCAAALGVANVVGAGGRAEWLANHVSASDRAADVALAALDMIAATLLSSTSAPL